MTNTQPHMITLIAAADRVCSAAQDGRGTSEASVQTVRVARGKRAGSNEGVETKRGPAATGAEGSAAATAFQSGPVRRELETQPRVRHQRSLVHTGRVARGERARSNEGVGAKGAGGCDRSRRLYHGNGGLNQVRSGKSWRLSHGRGTS